MKPFKTFLFQEKAMRAASGHMFWSNPPLNDIKVLLGKNMGTLRGLYYDNNRTLYVFSAYDMDHSGAEQLLLANGLAKGKSNYALYYSKDEKFGEWPITMESVNGIYFGMFTNHTDDTKRFSVSEVTQFTIRRSIGVK